MVAVKDIRLDGGTQARADIDLNTVESYKQSMEDGCIFPNVIVFFDGKDYWLADGFHRLAAKKACGLEHISVDFRDGTREDAVLFAAGANQRNGLRRTNADKRRAVELLLACDRWRRNSDRWIAEKCGVGNDLVGAVRKQVSESDTSRTRTGRDGKEYPLPKDESPRAERSSDRGPVGTNDAPPQSYVDLHLSDEPKDIPSSADKQEHEKQAAISRWWEFRNYSESLAPENCTYIKKLIAKWASGL
jgi:hypothetical protein